MPARPFAPATSSFARSARRSTPEKTSARARTTPSSPSSTASSPTSGRRTRSARFRSTPRRRADRSHAELKTRLLEPFARGARPFARPFCNDGERERENGEPRFDQPEEGEDPVREREHEPGAARHGEKRRRHDRPQNRPPSRPRISDAEYHGG